jgi:hypothetical protein
VLVDPGIQLFFRPAACLSSPGHAWQSSASDSSGAR